jgi:hypothetical protein
MAHQSLSWMLSLDIYNTAAYNRLYAWNDTPHVAVRYVLMMPLQSMTPLHVCYPYRSIHYIMPS